MSARILVAGAGLGGLTTALALQREGFAVELFEQAPALAEVGAGLTLSRGAQHVFRALGVQDRLAPLLTRSTAFPFVHYRSGRVLAGVPDHGDGAPDDGCADVARQCHRADLHAVLAAALAQRAPAALRLGRRLVGIEQDAHELRVRFADGSSARGDALIASDGVRSIARTLLWGERAPRFTGQIAYRFLVPRTVAAPYLALGRGAVLLGPERTFNRYTLRGGTTLNCVGLAASEHWVGEGWSTPATCEEMLATFAGWHPDVTGLIGHAASPIKWGLFDHAPLPRWSVGQATLLGDAAHAMLPFLGMGAAMAIEDGMILARAFAAEASVPAALARYEAARIPRTTLIHARSAEQGALSQARDPDAYNAAAAPAADPAILAYDPVTAPI